MRKEPFVIVSKRLVDDMKISATAKNVYLILCRYSNNETREASIARSTICRKAGISDSTLTRALKSLKDGGYIKVKANYTKDFYGNFTGGRASNSYEIIDT